MSSTAVIPSTIEGIKRLANAIKRDQHIPHTQALDVAAHRAGFSNFRNAQNRLRTEPSGRTSRDAATYPIWITAYWRDKENHAGRETLRVSCRVPWGSALKPSEFMAARGLCKFRSDAADHLESRADLVDQAAARRAICEAARTLQFMEVTGLRPLTGHVYRLTRAVDTMPRRDHTSAWRDPDTQAVVVVDEPYSATTEGMLDQRAPWALDVGAAISATSWAGMYYPGVATMFLTSLEGRADLLQRLAAQLDVAADPIDAETWAGESAPYKPIFISPERAASGRSKRARTNPLYRGLVRRKAIVYGQVFVGGSWRPNARMPLDGHREAGNLLKELLERGGFRSRAYSRLNHVRSELDEWVQREYTSHDDLPNDEFHKLYYREFTSSDRTTREALLRVGELITEHYPDCVPRRDLLRSLSTAQRDLDR